MGDARGLEPVTPSAEEPAAEEPAAEEPTAEESAADRILPRRSAMAVRLVALAVALVLAIVLAFVVVVFTGPPSVDELRVQAGLDGKRELLIGVKDDQPGVAQYADGRWTGFDIDIAYLIAEELGFRRSEIRFLSIESEDRARMQATDRNGERVGVDMVIASYSITPAREQMAGVTFSAPYLYTEQAVMTRRGHAPVSSLEDLKGRRVCSLAASTSESPATRVGALLSSRKKISECFAALDRDDFDAITTDAAILAGYKAKFPGKYDHWDIGLDITEAWGVNVGENPALRDLVNLALYRSRNDPKDNRWEEAFDRNFRVEEAVNEPAPIAVGAQPAVEEPSVRQWPWERV
ncbi:glutamate transport system substrate-binding protein [Krasilnikovia cinnamomea]|uniref:Glutamate transport system substrate-binding protein n=1 Tax=Krasilnikovia cinnamomea TaxID=349313 RepID=A0A4Q7ZFZ8_9ACTN|nr:transporter substrate-binding domain-containing protein [Krasilnikovia cinnamomea]RZU49073.1 glutamate transport system substrate-binding protein [Krasilnikovia cinnamomea]